MKQIAYCNKCSKKTEHKHIRDYSTVSIDTDEDYDDDCNDSGDNGNLLREIQCTVCGNKKTFEL